MLTNSTEIAFVVLHYIVDQDTVECVESIRRWIDTGSYKIIIIDNCSPNDSYEKLRLKYEDASDIVLIHNDSNLGFAKGNNVGFTYAKHQLNAKFVVMMNNDILLIEPDFYKKVNQEYLDNGFAVLGPMIFTKDGTCNSNPYRSSSLSIDDVKYLIKDLRRRILFAKYHAEGVYQKLFKPRDVTRTYKTNNFISRQENVCLHGCFLVFSDLYIKKYNGLNDKTFLYVEEDILYWEMMKDGMKTVYLPDIRVFHKEDSATKAATKSNRAKRLFFYTNLISSLSVLMGEMEKENDGHKV